MSFRRSVSPRRSPSPYRRSPSPRRDRERDRSRSPRHRRYSRSPPRYRPRRSPLPRRRDYGSERDLRTSCTLFIGNLPYHFRERDVAEYFERCGRLRNVTVGINRRTGQSKGHAFVEFEDRRDAEDAFERFQGYNLEGRRLRIDWDIGIDKKRAFASTSRGPGRSPPRRYSRSPPRRSGSHSPSSARRSRSPSPNTNKSPRNGSPSNNNVNNNDKKRSRSPEPSPSVEKKQKTEEKIPE